MLYFYRIAAIVFDAGHLQFEEAKPPSPAFPYEGSFRAWGINQE